MSLESEPNGRVLADQDRGDLQPLEQGPPALHERDPRRQLEQPLRATAHARGAPAHEDAPDE